MPLILVTIEGKPMATNNVLKSILELYGKPYCFTEAILQTAHTNVWRLIFSDLKENVGYTLFVKEDLEKWASCVIFVYKLLRDEMEP